MKKIYSLFVFTMLSLSACLFSPPQPQSPESEAQAPTAPQVPQVESSNASGAESSAQVNIKADVWADNWFAFYSGENLIKEDSVSIATERSFNAETFTFTAFYPLTLNFIAKDFKQDDTGLEYIGTNRQQMGDGGLIAQFINADTGEAIAVTNSNWSCKVIHEAPLDRSCERETNPSVGVGACGFTSLEEPKGWKSVDFDTSSWSAANVYTANQVSPKDGYNQIAWDNAAQFIWGPDLETNNIVLCKLTIEGNQP